MEYSARRGDDGGRPLATALRASSGRTAAASQHGGRQQQVEGDEREEERVEEAGKDNDGW